MSNINDRIGQKNTIRVISAVSGSAGGIAILAENVIGGIASVSQLSSSGIASFSDDVYIDGSLYISDYFIFNDNVTYIDGDLIVTGISSLNIANVSDLTTNQLEVLDSSTLNAVDSLDIKTNQLEVSGISTFNFINSKNLLSENLKVTGISTLNIANVSDLIVTGISSLNIANVSDLIVAGISSLNIANVSDLFAEQLRVSGVSTFSDSIIQIGDSFVGLGTTNPEQKLDIVGSIKISENIYDSTNFSGQNAYFLSRDEEGIRWVPFSPTFTEGIYLQDEGSFISKVGIAQSFTVLNFSNINSFGVGNDNIIPTASDDNIPTGLSTIFTKDFWGFTPGDDIYRMTNVGIKTNDPKSSLDLYGDLHVTEQVNLDSSLNVSGITTIDNDLIVNNTVDALKYFGDGVNLSGIVTQITAGIGVRIQGTQIPGKGIVNIDAYKPTGKTIFVNQNGDDNNSGLSENYAKKTIKAASNVAVFGDTIKVYPGVYIEENPIVLKKTVSVEGTELRNCVVTTRYSYLDLFHVNNGCHITDMSFIGPEMTDGAAVVALQPLQGVSVDRYFDAARMIRFNLDYIANETVGFLTSGFSGFAGNHREQDAARLIDKNINYIAEETVGFLTSPTGHNFVDLDGGDYTNCKEDVVSIMNAVSYDLKANSNRKSVGAALSYFNSSGGLIHITGIATQQATIAALNHAVGIAYSVINNVSPPTSYQSGISSIPQVIDLSVIQVPGGCVAVGNTISQLVGIITSAIGIGNTSSLPPVRYGVNLESKDCADDIKDIWKCVIHDITRGGNFRCIDAGKAYYDNNWNLIPQIFKNPGEVEQTVASVNYSLNVARAAVNNVTWGGYPVGLGTIVENAEYNEITGITTISVTNHGLIEDDAIKIVGLGFTCPSGPGIVTYPSGSFGYIFNVLKVVDNNNFEVVVGQSTLPHTYDSGGTIQKFISFNHNFYQVKDFGIQKDPLTGFNNAINGCSNVISAMHSCVGIVTNIVGLGSDAFNIVGIRTSYPGNSGIGLTSTLQITSATYDEVSGKTTINAPGLKAVKGESIELRNLNFSCSSGGEISTQFFPSGRYGYDFFIDKINTDGSFEVYVGASTLPHTYTGGGTVLDRTIGVTTAIYDNVTGIATIKANGLSIETGDLVKIRGLEFSCPSGAGTTTIYPTGNNGYEFRVLDIITDKPIGITSAIYNNITGIATITAPGINVSYDSLVELRNLEFSCSSGAGTTTIYPTGNNGYKFRVLSSIGSTFTVNVGSSTIPHNYVFGGIVVDRTNTANDTFTIDVGSSTIPHNYVSGGIVIPPFSRGVGPITQGPYVRNCTNFIPKSIGMKVDGFAAEPGDQNDIGVTGTMSVDSYTQYNQGGIGVSITNGAYAQLVSIFTICDDIGIYTESGGQCDITNSNCSFGNYGLYSKGVGDSETKSIYRYTGIVNSNALQEQATIEVSGVGNLRPYDGQAIYFGELYYEVKGIKVIDGGFGYTQPPVVTIDFPTGPSGIRAEASANIDSFGRVTSIDIISTGSQYRLKDVPKITIPEPTGTGIAATAVLDLYPLYYTIESASLPSAGISTIILNTNLNSLVGAGTTVYFTRLSLQIATSISLEWVGAGTNINTAKPALGGVTIQENEVFKDNGGQVVYTSTNQAGNFQIGDDIKINQLTGTISGRAFNQSILNTITPLIIALGN